LNRHIDRRRNSRVVAQDSAGFVGPKIFQAQKFQLKLPVALNFCASAK